LYKEISSEVSGILSCRNEQWLFQSLRNMKSTENINFKTEQESSAILPAIKVEQQNPCHALAPYIRCYWQIEHYLPEGNNIEVPFGCTGRSHFVFTLRNPFSASLDYGESLNVPQSTFFCQVTRPITKYISGPTLAVIVDFNATGFSALWNLPVHELSERFYDLNNIVSSEIRQLTEQMQQANTAQRRFTLLDHYFLSRLAKIKRDDGRIQAAVNLIQQQPATILVNNLASYVNCSERTLNRRFTEQVGVSPKYFTRIQRFLKTRFWLENQTRPSWNDIMLKTGYYDQSHLVNEFRYFAGKSPLQYGAGNSDLHDIFRQE